MKFFQLGLLVAFLFLYLFFMTIQSEVTRAILYLAILLLCTTIMLVDAVAEKNPFVAWSGLGDLKRAAPAFVLGTLIMFIGYATTTLSISAPLAITSNMELLIIYAVISAPFIEETGFAGAFFHSLGNIFKGNGIPFSGFWALLAIAGLFAVFHGVAYGWALGGLALAFTFRIFANVGNQVFKTTAFGMGAHVTNNLMFFLASIGIILSSEMTIAVAVGLFLLLIIVGAAFMKRK